MDKYLGPQMVDGGRGGVSLSMWRPKLIKSDLMANSRVKRIAKM